MPPPPRGGIFYDSQMTTRTRFAPSPTGYLHVGGARTALYCYLQARHDEGTFVLRIEDTDRERSTDAATDAILDGMAWLGLEADEGPYFQSRRGDRYREVLERLLAEGHAYRCYCSKERLAALRESQMQAGIKPRYDRRCRHLDNPPDDGEAVIRFANPEQGEVVFDDLVRGTIRISNDELDDLVIMRADGSPTYNFGVVVDDLDMAISHVIRGDDHINNTPRQINIYRALDAEPPAFAHVPMILGDDGARLSKRHGAVSVLQYRADGYLPQALLNYLVRLGWSHGDQEVFSLDEMIELFDVSQVNRKAASFDTEKLNWLNQHYLRELPAAQVAPHLAWQFDQLDIDTSDGPDLEDVIAVQADRAKTLREMAEQSRIFYQDYDEFDAGAAKKHLRPVARPALERVREKLEAVEQWAPEALHQAVVDTAAFLEINMGKVAQPLRVALTGTAVSPSIDKTLWLLGREASLERITRAMAWIVARERRLQEQ